MIINHTISIPCPVQVESTAVIESTAQLAAALRKLKKAMKHCEVCDNDGTCTIIAQFNQAFATAIQEVADEWQLQ